MLKQQLELLVAQTTLKLSDQQITQLIEYVNLLVKWNKAYNLTSIRDPQEMLVKHILDSLMVGEKLKGRRFIDVGTGPGLPGIPLAILYPERSFTLLDSLGKRVTFLKQVKHALLLKNIEPVQSRVEQFKPEQLFEGVLSRAFASLTDMVNWCHHLTQNGTFYALKGLKPTDEIAQLPNTFQVVDCHKIIVPQLNAERHLIEIVKK
jgi:16S rRNA (guanine527-N7)-methyltransferase